MCNNREQANINLMMAIQGYPCLWDHFSRDYNNRNKKIQAYQEIIQMTGLTVVDIKTRFKSCKTQYFKKRRSYLSDLKKNCTTIDGGCTEIENYVPQPSWYLYELMSFLEAGIERSTLYGNNVPATAEDGTVTQLVASNSGNNHGHKEGEENGTNQSPKSLPQEFDELMELVKFQVTDPVANGKVEDDDIDESIQGAGQVNAAIKRPGDLNPSKPAGGTKAPKKTKHYNSFMNSNFKLKQEQGFRTKKDDDYNYYHLCMNICRRLDDVTQEVKVDSVKRLHDISLMLDLSLLSNKDTLCTQAVPK